MEVSPEVEQLIGTLPPGPGVEAYHQYLDEKVIRQALLLGWHDFEDAVQMCTAVQLGANYLITRNVKDFKGGDVPAILPVTYLSLLSPIPDEITNNQ